MKSFSQLTKEELCKAEYTRECCRQAVLAGMLLLGAVITKEKIRFVTENADVLSVYMNQCEHQRLVRQKLLQPPEAVRYSAELRDEEQIAAVLDQFRLLDPDTGVIRYRIDPFLTEKECCRKAFVRGAFLSGGTVIDPKKNYNLEMVTPYLGLSRDMHRLLLKCGFDFKMVTRKSKYVLYLKNSEAISDFLTYMGAYQAQMELLNIKIEKEIRNDFNRTANSETANLEKTINASVRQVQAIEKIQRTRGLDSLPDDLREIAVLRLKHKELSLSELGMLMNPPLSKSGVNHRLKKLMELA